MASRSLADQAELRRFHIARLERFLRLVDETSREMSPERAELARRAAITAYCDCYDAGAAEEAQILMDRFLDLNPSWANRTRARRRETPLD